METYTKIKPLSVAQQKNKIESSYPNFKCIMHMGSLTITGLIKPTPLSQTYKIKILYKIQMSPKTYVIEPEIKAVMKDKSVPHTYPDGSICLYYPKYKEWTKTMHIADTIIPWLSLWLYYYEIWQISGEWLGGGHEGKKR